VPGLSENIHVRSIVGRFLEHSRVYYFKNGGNEQIYLGSADLMPRNLDRRIEVLFPVEAQRLIRQLRDQVLALYLADNVNAHLMQTDGTYLRLLPEKGAAPIDSQSWFINRRTLPVSQEIFDDGNADIPAAEKSVRRRRSRVSKKTP
jgi:polyphosphate kinase